MTAPSASDPSGEFDGFPLIGDEGIEQKSPRLVLSDEQYRLEHVLAYAAAPLPCFDHRTAVQACSEYVRRCFAVGGRSWGRSANNRSGSGSK